MLNPSAKLITREKSMKSIHSTRGILKTVILAASCTALFAAAPEKSAGAKAMPVAGKSRAKVDTLVVTARVSEIPGKFAPNDLYNYVYIMKYKIIKVEKGAYAGKDILVGHYNPLIPRTQVNDAMDKYVDGDVAKFEVGNKHRLTLIQPVDLVWTDAVEDQYFDSDLQKFYCLKSDVVK